MVCSALIYFFVSRGLCACISELQREAIKNEYSLLKKESTKVF